MNAEKMRRVVLVLLAGMFVCGSVWGAWGEPLPVNGVNTQYDEWTPFLSFDGLSLYFGRLYTDSFFYARIYEARRAEPAGPFTSVTEVLRSTGHVLSPWVSPDNLRMYYHNELSTEWLLKISERASVGDPWPQGVEISELSALGSHLYGPSLTADELIIFFGSPDMAGGQGGYDIWTAARPDTNSPFGDVRSLAEINTASHDSNPSISPDGLELYLDSNRNGATQLFRARREALDQPFGPPEHLSFFDTPGGGSGHPCISSDDTALYFLRGLSGERPDIWVSYKTDGGPVAHWKFDEGTGPTAYDSAGTNDGTVYGAQWTAGILEWALEFDGVDDYVRVNDDPSLDGMNALALTAWVKTAGSDSSTGVVHKYFHFDGDNWHDSFFLSVLNDGKVNVGYSLGNTQVIKISSTTVDDNSWHHIGAVYTGLKGSIYIDGNEVPLSRDDPDPGGAINDSNEDLFVGCANVVGSLDAFFDGTIDDVRIYDRALSADEIGELYRAGQGPVAHWKFDEGSGGTAYDSAGTNDGTIYGATWTTGVLDSALDFDGDDGIYVEPSAGADSPLNIYDTDLTISSWVKVRGTAESTIVARAQPLYTAYRSGVVEKRAFINTYRSGHWFLSTDDILSQDTWYHIVGVFDRGNDVGRVYVNGVKEAEGSMTTDPLSTDAMTKIGCRNDTSDRPFDGNAAVFYVDGINGSDLNDGLSLETAFATIQKGIDEANDGNAVLVYPAVYTEATDFKRKAITVQGVATSAGGPVIEAPGDFAVSFYTAEEANSVLKNFVIRNSFRGVFIAGASPTISNLTVVGNEFGIAAYAGAEPNISNCIFYNNTDGDLFQCEARYSWTQEGLGPVAEGLVSYWKFDEGSGTTAYDWVGSNDGTLVNGPLWTTGQVGGALEFDAVDDYVVGSSSPFDFENTSFSVTAWFNTTGDKQNIVSEGGYLGGWILNAGGSGHEGRIKVTLKRAGSTNDAYTAIVTTAYNDGNWHHVGAVISTDTSSYLGNGADIYIDGSLVSVTEAQLYAYGAASDPWKIGTTEAQTSYFKGQIDDVRIYDRALSAEEVQELYEYGLGPMFADAAGGDYHLKSERGRYWPAYDVWVLDDVTSPGVDGGDPAVEPSGERMPNGGRINMGAYGGTPYASMSEWALAEDTNRDGIVNLLDLAMLADKWLEKLEWVE
jgi:parallel beta-helix repeat protein